MMFYEFDWFSGRFQIIRYSLGSWNYLKNGILHCHKPINSSKFIVHLFFQTEALDITDLFRFEFENSPFTRKLLHSNILLSESGSFHLFMYHRFPFLPSLVLFQYILLKWISEVNKHNLIWISLIDRSIKAQTKL